MCEDSEFQNTSLKNGEIEIDTVTLEKDLIRTPTKYKDLLKTLLINTLLKFPEINYFQGLNFIGKYLLKYTEGNLELSSKILQVLMRNYFSHFVPNDFKDLSKFFYILRKIFEIQFPDVYYNLFTHGQICLNSIFFSPMITLFSKYDNETSTVDPTYLTSDIIDIILTSKNYMILIKVWIVIFSRLEPKLMNMISHNMDLMTYLTAKPSNPDSFMRDILTADFSYIKQEIEHFKIDNQAMTKYLFQYDYVQLKVKEFIENMKKHKNRR